MKILNTICLTIDLLAGVLIVLTLCLAIDIEREAVLLTPEPADAAIVLGAAVMGDEPSPVFIERLRFAVALYEAGTVASIVVSGGLNPSDSKSEGEAGRDWIISEGVPAADVAAETQSRTTQENLAFSMPLLEERGASRVLIVSDPLHLRRALLIAEGLGIDARPAPTPTSRYLSDETRFEFLMREIWFSYWYAISGR